jgi:hypothetical protein
MLFAHIVPSYVIVSTSQPSWDTQWSPAQHKMLWAAALVSTIVPDIDVVYNTLFRGFTNHSTLYTHSLFPYLLLGIISIGLYAVHRAKYMQTLLMLIAFGGLSHLVLDVIAHNTPLFYPLSNAMIGNAPARITNGGIAQYITHPIFLLEPTLIIMGILYWIHHRDASSFAKRQLSRLLVAGWVVFIALYLIMLPTMQNAADSWF